jgi:hypothetical protein
MSPARRQTVTRFKGGRPHDMPLNQMPMHALRGLGLTLLCLAGAAVQSAPVTLLRTQGYESPVQADPDDLLMLAGTGFEETDRVVYEAATGLGREGSHPAAVPEKNTAQSGTAALVLLADPPYALTVRMPEAIESRRAYRIWVVNPAGEWSESVSINDPRPQWITPSFAYSSVDFGNLERHIRIVGRNLEPTSQSLRIRLTGPAEYRLESQSIDAADVPALSHYVVEARLPARLAPGSYAVSVSRDGRIWSSLSAQRFEVRPDPAPLPQFELSDPQFGGCHPDDGLDDGVCLAQAIEAAQSKGGAVVRVPAGRWDLFATRTPQPLSGNGFVLPHNVHLLGSGPDKSLIVRHAARDAPGALLTLTGNNSVVGIGFTDTDRYTAYRESRAVIQLGLPAPRGTPADGPDGAPIQDIVVSNNVFRRVGRAIVDSGRSVERLLVTRNELGAYDNALLLIGSRSNVARPFRITDSVFRENRFIPGSYLDVAVRQGAIASQLGAAQRVDFSSNIADGQSHDALQDAADVPGWRAGFFWNANGIHEQVLIAANLISCPGDKAGDGEAIALDGNGNTFAFNGAPTAVAAGPDRVAIAAPLLTEQNGHPINRATYYIGHWIQVVAGPGVGQTRRIVSYATAPSGVTTLRVAPGWDVVPRAGSTRIIVGRQFWQVYTVANRIEQRSPQCRKANLSGPHGGLISLWAATADSTVEANQQADSDGIVIQQAYGAKAASCPTCGNGSNFHTALAIRNNVIDGEYDWGSDCSNSGILGSFAAAPTPESPPPILGFGIDISHNSITHADNLRGGAIDIASTWHRGPPPQDWPLVENLIIAHNRIQNVTGPAPRDTCHFPQRRRTALRLEGTGNVRDTILYGNRCEQVDALLEDSGRRTLRVCSQGSPGNCECPAHSQP